MKHVPLNILNFFDVKESDAFIILCKLHARTDSVEEMYNVLMLVGSKSMYQNLSKSK